VRSALAIAVAIGVGGCPDQGLTVRNADPEAVILAPSDGAVVIEGDVVRFVARVDDLDDAVDTLTVGWSIEVGPLIGVPGTDGEDLTLDVEGIPVGPHTVTLTVADPEGADDSDTISLTVERNAPPDVEFEAPAANAEALHGDAVTVTVVVSDDRDLPEDLDLAWSGAATAGPEAPNGDGRASVVLLDLPLGPHTVTIEATDTRGVVGTATVAFTVVDGDVDDDGFLSELAGGPDCDDHDEDVFPGADERCNDADDDCDDVLDEDAVDAPTWFLDGDDDGYGRLDVAVVACVGPADHVANALDCDDARGDVNPAEAEVCNSVDDDCSGAADQDAVDRRTFYVDGDDDGYGASPVLACPTPAGAVDGAGDCDDARRDVNPGAAEVCNSRDDDCDNVTDEPNPTAPLWYRDGDVDSYGDPADSTRACAAPSGYVANASDCDDDLGSVKPGVAERCNSYDDNCDGVVDTDAVDRVTWYRDQDGDGYGRATTSTLACAPGVGWSRNADDCDDDASGKNPGVNADGDASNACVDCADHDNQRYVGAPERCNGLDDDCNGSAPGEGDGDSDGTLACNDCNDGNGAIEPGAPESCDGVDQDCDGFADDGAGTCPCPVYWDAAAKPWLFCEASANWSQAIAGCAAAGYQVATILSASETAFIRDTIADYPWEEPTTGQQAADAWWTAGFRDTGTNGSQCALNASPWQWRNVGAWTGSTYKNWRSSNGTQEPNNLTGCEGCVEVWFDGGWNDEDCGRPRNYLCRR
jgi:hypothetical protein